MVIRAPAYAALLLLLAQANLGVWYALVVLAAALDLALRRQADPTDRPGAVRAARFTLAGVVFFTAVRVVMIVVAPIL